jgi:ribosomal protein S18 acetylase RimI-like enzyme
MSRPELEDLEFRLAGPADAPAVASLHADSWRRHYRGAYSDSFLDGDVGTDRLAVWTGRLEGANPGCRTIVAQDGGALVGFAHVVFDDDPIWGALLDNLHVAHRYQRRGIGSRLLALSARSVSERPERTGLYLWVLEQNVESQAFTRPVAGGGWSEPRRRLRVECRAGSTDPRRSCDTPGRIPPCWPR